MATKYYFSKELYEKTARERGEDEIRIKRALEVWANKLDGVEVIFEDNCAFAFIKKEKIYVNKFQCRKKQITITLPNDGEEHTLHCSDDLYNLYNSWLSMHDNAETHLQEEEIEICEYIRDYYSVIWDEICDGTYTLEKFEKLAMEVLEHD